MSKIGYIMKSSKGIVRSRWDCLPLLFEEIVSRSEMWLHLWLRQWKYQRVSLIIFPPISSNLNDLLGFDNFPCLNLFMNLKYMKDYICTITDDNGIYNRVHVCSISPRTSGMT